MAYQVQACQVYVEPNMYLYTPLELFTKLSKTSVRVYGREMRTGRGRGREGCACIGCATFLTMMGLIIRVWTKFEGTADELEWMDPPEHCCSSSLSRSSNLRFLFACLVFTRCACDSRFCSRSAPCSSKRISGPYLLAKPQSGIASSRSLIVSIL